MTKEEAFNFLPVKELEDLEDVFEEKLFEMKQFLMGRFPVTKVFQGRLRKLENLRKAFQAFGGKETSFQEVPKLLIEQRTVQNVVEEFQQKRSVLKLRMMSSSNGSEIAEIVEAMIVLTRSYAEKWFVMDVDTTGILVGTEPDPMELLSGLKEFKELGHTNFESIAEISEQNVLAREVKRLSLWQKMDSHE